MKIIELSQKLKKTHKIELNPIFNSPFNNNFERGCCLNKLYELTEACSECSPGIMLYTSFSI